MNLKLVWIIQLADLLRLLSKYIEKTADIIETSIQTAPVQKLENSKEKSEKTKEKPEKTKEKPEKTKEKPEKTKEKPEKTKEKKERSSDQNKKTGYQLFFNDSMQALKKTAEGKSDFYLEIMIPELSTIISKNWNALDESDKQTWREKADDYNIIYQSLDRSSQNIDKLPHKHKKIVAEPSSELSDTVSDEEIFKKKIKTN